VDLYFAIKFGITLHPYFHFVEHVYMKKHYTVSVLNLVFTSCYRVHVVFGHVLSGQDVASHIEGLPVDRMCRPLQDAKVVNCGELVLKMKVKGKELLFRIV